MSVEIQMAGQWLVIIVGFFINFWKLFGNEREHRDLWGKYDKIDIIQTDIRITQQKIEGDVDHIKKAVDELRMSK